VLSAQPRLRPGQNVEPVVVSSASLRRFRFLRLLGRASSYSHVVLDAGSLVRTELRPSVNFLIFARPPRDDASPSGEPLAERTSCSC
jgi:hypothetical protein